MKIRCLLKRKKEGGILINKKRINQLLDNPYLGQDTFSSFADYQDCSNCHGTSLYVLDMYDYSRPLNMHAGKMKPLITTFFKTFFGRFF